MYTEEPRREIDWFRVIKKGLLLIVIILIIFLIIWLFTRSNNNSNKVKVNYDNNTNIKETNTKNNGSLSNPDLYSESFITNYTYFHDTARDFVEKNNLPILNNTVKYTLKELIDKEILLPTSYGNTTCDTDASYVTVTNNDGKYVMVTTLICGKEIAKTTEELKCSGLCNGSCDSKEEEISKEDNYKLEYEFKQAYTAKETVYTCPSGYTKTGTGANTKCVKGTSSVVTPTKVENLTCPSGYTKSGSSCIKSNNATLTVPAKSNTTYSCSNGTLTSDNRCAVTSSGYTTYTCSDGSTPNSNHMCPAKNTTYTCDDGTHPANGICYKTTTSSYYIYHNMPYATYNGCTYSGIVPENCPTCPNKVRNTYAYKCTSTSQSSYNATSSTNTVYNTPATAKYVGGSTTYTSATPKTTYTCEKGTLNGTNCIVANNNQEKVNPIKSTTYVCPNGYTKQGIAETSTCVANNSVTVNPSTSTKNVTKYKYKWSEQTTLSGWTKTGKTRKVTSK